jgi:hypothetical protein
MGNEIFGLKIELMAYRVSTALRQNCFHSIQNGSVANAQCDRSTSAISSIFQLCDKDRCELEN